jgi:hypothetical protein
MSPRDRLVDRWPQLIAELLPLVARQREKASMQRARWNIEAFGPPEPDLETLLRSEIAFAVQQHEVEPWAEAQADAMTLHESAGPVDAVLAALGNPANDGAVYLSLGDGDFLKGVRRRDALVGYLTRLGASAARHKPRKRPNHRPADIALRRFVGSLANVWVGATGWTFGSDWRDGVPVSPAAQFAQQWSKPSIRWRCPDFRPRCAGSRTRAARESFRGPSTTGREKTQHKPPLAISPISAPK